MEAEYPGWPAEFADRYRQAGFWTGETLGEFLRTRAARHANRIAVVGGDQRWTYSELDRRSDQLASGFFSLGIRSGDRVVVQLPNTVEFLAVCFGLFRLGALPVFALPAHRASEIGYFCEFTEAVAYVIADRHAGFDYRELAGRIMKESESLRHVVVVGDAGEFTSLDELYSAEPNRELIDPEPDSVAFLQLSGGSTGVPKLIPRTHDDYLYSVRASADICELDTSSVYLSVLPVAHNFPLSSPGILGALHAGSTIVLATSPSPDIAFPLIESERVTIAALVPPLAMIWLQAAESSRYDLSSLQVLQVGGAKFNAEVASRVTPVLGARLQQVFGMAEGLVNYTRLDDPDEVIVHTQGRPISPADEIRIVDDNDIEVRHGVAGNLLTRGPYTIRGYYRASEHNATAFTEDGFYRTGDIVQLTDGGYLVVEGRVKDQINRGGEKVAAEEIENHILAHPSVLDAAVVALPDAYLGERACAYIIARAEPPAATEIMRFLRDRGLATYKIPDRIEFIDEFPQTGVGKVSRRDLRQAIVQQRTEGE